MPKTVPTIPFSMIDRRFQLASYFWGEKFCPAVARRNNGGYLIRVLASTRGTSTSQTTTYDYFELDADGVVTAAPRGYARDYKPGRVVGLDEALAEYAAPKEA